MGEPESTDHLSEKLAREFADASPAGVVAAYLFGSHAAGRAHRESDVDVGVLLDHSVFPDPAQRFDERVRLTGQLIGVLHRNDVDVVILNDAPPFFARRVVLEGHQLYAGDLARTHAFVRDVQLRAADLAPFLQRMQAIKLAVPAWRPWLVERLAELERHLDHLEALSPRVPDAHALATDLSLHNDVLFSLLTVCQLVIDMAGEIAARRGARFEDYTGAVRALAADSRFPAELVGELERLPGFRNVLVHEYVALDLARAVDAMRRLAPIRRFAEIVRTLLAAG